MSGRGETRSWDPCGSAIMVPTQHLAQEQHQSCPELSRAVLAGYADELGARMQCAACERCPRPAPRSCHLSVGPRGARSPHPAHHDARREGCTRVVIFARIFGNSPVIHLHYLQDKSDIFDTRTICAHAIWWTIEGFRWDRGDFHNSRFSTEMEDNVADNPAYFSLVGQSTWAGVSSDSYTSNIERIISFALILGEN